MSTFRAYHGKEKLDGIDYPTTEAAWLALLNWYDNLTLELDEFEVGTSACDEISDAVSQLEQLAIMSTNELGTVQILIPGPYIGDDLSHSAVSVRKIGKD